MNKYITESLKYFLRSNLFISKYYGEIKSLYEMSPIDLRDRNEKLFLKLFHLAYTKSPFYNQLYQKAGIQLEDIQKLEDIKKLPIITKDLIREKPESLLTCKKWRLISNHTSGTTGTPLTIYENWALIWKARAYYAYYRKLCGFTYGEPLVSLRGSLSKKNISMYLHISNTLFLSSYNINEKTIKQYWEKIEAHKPKAIEGYPSTLYNLAIHIKDQGLRCNIPLCFTSSETLFDYQRELIQQVFNTQIYDHYGLTERSIALCENFDHNGYFEQPGYSINEYLKEGVITTSLINSAFPLIRYKINDIIDVEDNYDMAFSSKRTIINSIKGRSNQYLIGKDGTRYSGGLTYIIKELDNIKNAQLVQREKGKLDINIVSDKELTTEQLNRLHRFLNERIGDNNMDFTINRINENQLIYTNNNKYNFIVSLS
ncbi:MAG: phenylacetate--CoA ligase family protein [Prevotella sp.]|nr:phenylacetate--CoA ligase family protein [Prevotella sp.]